MDLNECDKQRTKKLLKRLRPSWYELRYDEIRNNPFLVGKKRENDEMRTLRLIEDNESINFVYLKNQINVTEKSNITLAITSDDSTCVFYKCQLGLKSPFVSEQPQESQDVNVEQ